MNKDEKLELFGQELLKRGFAAWFRVMFKLIEQRPFIVEPIHPPMFETFNKIFEGKTKRQNINLPPRAGKTSFAKYLVAFGITVNPKSNFIYSSYSQSLLNTIATEIRDILEHPIYQKMYPQKVMLDEDLIKPKDEFWADYLLKTTGKNFYSTKKIITYMGGNCLFASIGGQLTGYGCGIRSYEGFSGALILDDANKPSDIRSEVLREKVLRYYEETLLSRLNNPNVPIINIQQRLHIEDLTGLLIAKYNFDTLKRPLLDDNGICQIPTQYTEERIKELQTNNYMFVSQYQQEPILPGGEVIKREWFKYYSTNMKYTYRRIFITADTAMKVKEANDFSVFIVAGVTTDNKLHVLDMRRGKWEAPDLKRKAIEVFEQYKWNDELSLSCSGLYIEDKASGTGLIQELQRYGVPVTGLQVNADKLTRVEEGLGYVEAGQVLLPNDENYGFNPDILNECEAFTRDDTHLHDDVCLVAGTKILTLFGYKNIEEVKPDDIVYTPLGFSKVISSTCTGIKETVKNIGLEGTKHHKVFCKYDDIFDELQNMTYNKVSKLTIKDIMLWKKMKWLCLMENGIIVMGKQDIIHHAMTNAIKNRGRDFTEMFGNFIAEKKYLRGIIFIILMGIELITTLIILNVLRQVNIIKNIVAGLRKYGKDQKCKKQAEKVEKNAKNGTQVKRGQSGTLNIKKNILKPYKLQKYAKSVEKNLAHLKIKDIKFIVENAEINFLKENCVQKQKVYNIKTTKGIYYANDIVVSNCDTLFMAIKEGLAKNKVGLLDYFLNE